MILESLLTPIINHVALSSLKCQEIGQGAAFTGMMRQLGGSFGVATITTFLSHQNAVHRGTLVTHLDVNDPLVMQRVHAIQQGFIRKGYSVDNALSAAYKSLDYVVTKQAAVLSYMDVFLYLGIMFLICIPFMLLVKNKKTKIDIGEAMH